MAGELFKLMAGIDMVHVPYRGSAPALAGLLGGQVQVMFDPMSSSIKRIRTGQLRPLAVTSTTRAAALPDVPSLGDLVPGYEADSWYGTGAPSGTPAGIVNRLNREVNDGLADPAIRARLADMGAMSLAGSPAAGSPADFGALIASETEKWAKVIRTAGIKVG